MEYVLAVPEQSVVIPEMAPGLAGALFTVTAKVCGALVPHPLVTATEIVPPLVPATVSMLSTGLVPDQLPGKVQV
jgi:hypothetical protein